MRRSVAVRGAGAFRGGDPSIPQTVDRTPRKGWWTCRAWVLRALRGLVSVSRRDGEVRGRAFWREPVWEVGIDLREVSQGSSLVLKSIGERVRRWIPDKDWLVWTTFHDPLGKMKLRS